MGVPIGMPDAKSGGPGGREPPSLAAGREAAAPELQNPGTITDLFFVHPGFDKEKV